MPAEVLQHQLTGGIAEWQIRSAVRVAGSTKLLIAGRLPGFDQDATVASPVDERRVDARVWSNGDLWLASLDAANATGGDGHWLGAAGSSDRTAIPRISTDIAVLLRSGVATLVPEERLQVQAFLVEALAGGETSLPRSVGAALHDARQALRPRLAPGVVVADGDRGLKIEVAARVDERTVYLRGWIGYASLGLRAVTAVSPEGVRIDILPTMFRYQRRDVARFYGEDDDESGYGFACLVRSPTPGVLASGWVVEVAPTDGQAVEGSAPDAVVDIHAVRNLLIGDLVLDHHDDLREAHIVPGITRVSALAQQQVQIVSVTSFGDVPERPDVTIIVPLYRRIDFVDHQLAHFADDPELSATELLYVLDSPELDEAFLAEAHRLFRFYGVPFRAAVLSHNGGFSTANNLGASLARGRLLLLMNSDVIPDRPGWVSGLASFYDSRPSIGALGPKLLYEDDSIQHAGMYFERPVGAKEWLNEHYFKGLHRSFAPASVSRRVPAVSAACLMIDAELYRRHGGLRGNYVQGDFEDSDLCLRLTDAGLEHWYDAEVELYHLEGQSYTTAQRVANGQYNRWLHTYLWNEQIERAMAEESVR